MNEERLQQLIEDIRTQKVSPQEALNQLRSLPFENIEGFANLDHHRSLRRGFPEVIYGENKTADQIIKITRKLFEKNNPIIITRLAREVYEAIRPDLPPGGEYYPAAKIFTWQEKQQNNRVEGILVLTAGTADIPIAKEAAITAEMMGNEVQRLYDVGVAGLHRLLKNISVLQKAKVIVVAAGMDGALPSVVNGLVACPVIAVLTSIGYGASFQGLAALLSMLNNCANGVAVVNIDNGFGAGYIASLINRQNHII
jgi:NCAIR mutase (PurE)-related protein